MKKLVAVTAGVWVAAVVSAVALGSWIGRHRLDEPPSGLTTLTVATPHETPQAPPAASPAPAESTTMLMPDIVITAPRPRARVAPRRAPRGMSEP